MDNSGETRDAAFYRGGFVLAAAYVLFGVLPDYDLNFTCSDLSYVLLPRIFRRGFGLRAGDFAHSFWQVQQADDNRGRYLSHITAILNAHLRIFLERFAPPHPSFTFAWIFNVVLAPYLLFKLMERLSGKRSTAWACAALYLLSPGFLSGIAMLFFSGKPFAHFAIVGALLLASWPDWRKGEAASKGPSQRRSIALASLLFLSCFFDETGWFAAAALTILFCAGIPRNSKQTRTILSYFAPFLCFLALMTIPIRGMESGIEFWRLLVLENEKFLDASFDLTRNSYYVLGCHFLPQAVLNGESPWAAPLFLSAFGLVAWLWSRGVETAQKKLLRRTALLLAAYLLYHALIMTRHPVVVEIFHSCFYYGSLTSLFLMMLFSVLLTTQSSALGRGAAKAFFAVWMMFLAFNFGGIDRQWKEWDVKETLISRRPIVAVVERGRDDASGPSFREVLRAWRVRNDPEALARLRREYPQSAFWLFNELDFIATPDVPELAFRRGGR